MSTAIGFADARETVPYVEWDDFYADLYYRDAPHRWAQGEHVAFIGKTNCGKTTLAYYLLEMRQYVTILATKPKSPSLDRFAAAHGYRVFTEWPRNITPQAAPKRVIWPHIRQLNEVTNQRYHIGMTLNAVFTEYNWCIYADELRYVTQTLNLGAAVEIILMQGRELGLSFMGGMQRPKFVPLVIYSQSSHLFFWRELDINNLERISAINSVDSRFVARVVTQLADHEFLYVHTPTGYMARSMAPAPGPSKGGEK